MKEYVWVQELKEILDKRIKEERVTKRVLSDFGQGVEYTSFVIDLLPKGTMADMCRVFAEKLKEELKEQGVKGIIYASNEDEIDTTFNIPKMIDNVLAEMEGEG